MLLTVLTCTLEPRSSLCTPPTRSHMRHRGLTRYFMVHSTDLTIMVMRKPVQLHLGVWERRVACVVSSAKEGKIKNVCCFLKIADFFMLDLHCWSLGIPYASGICAPSCPHAIRPPIRPQTRPSPAGPQRTGSGDASIAAQGCAAPTIFSLQPHYTHCHAKP